MKGAGIFHLGEKVSAFYLSGCVVIHLIISTNINEFLLYSTHFEGQCFDIFDKWCKKNSTWVSYEQTQIILRNIFAFAKIVCPRIVNCVQG